MNNFENWLKEIESFRLRFERVYEETVDHPQGSEAAKRQWDGNRQSKFYKNLQLFDKFYNFFIMNYYIERQDSFAKAEIE